LERHDPPAGRFQAAGGAGDRDQPGPGARPPRPGDVPGLVHPPVRGGARLTVGWSSVDLCRLLVRYGDVTFGQLFCRCRSVRWAACRTTANSLRARALTRGPRICPGRSWCRRTSRLDSLLNTESWLTSCSPSRTPASPDRLSTTSAVVCVLT